MHKFLLIVMISVLISNITYAQADTLKAYGYFQKGYQKEFLKNYKDAKCYYDSAVIVNPNYSKTYFYRALVRYYLNDIQGSVYDYNAYILSNPSAANAYDNRGYSKFLLGDNKAALDDYNKSISLKPNRTKPW